MTKDPKACNYASFKRDCPKTCNMCDKAPMPSCVKKGSVGSCQNCRTSEQCSGSGTYCCPYMKKCISSGQKCYAPVAECNPRCPATSSPVTECKGCKTVNLMGGWDKWAPPTCGSFEGTKSTSKGGACTKWQDCASMCCSNGAGQSCTSSSGKCCDHDGLGTATSCKKGGSAPVSTGKGQRQTPDQCLSSKADWKGYTCARAKRERYCQHRKWGADVRECCAALCNARDCTDKRRKCNGWAKYCDRPDMTVGGVPLSKVCPKTCRKC